MFKFCHKIKRLLISIAFCFILFLVTVLPSFAAFSYSRTPSGTSITSPVHFNFTADSIDDIAGSSDVIHSWRFNPNNGVDDWFGACHSDSVLSTSEDITFSSSIIVTDVLVDSYTSSDCSGDSYNLLEMGDTGFAITDISTPTPTTTTTSSPTSTPTPTPTPIPLKDTVAPVISISTDFAKPFREAPIITGFSSDSGAINIGVAKVEYSIDGGKNWLPVDTGTTRFEFNPPIFEDGNYKIEARAKDNSGNLGYSSIKTLVVDRLPPQVGGMLFSLGPQVLIPTKEGVVLTLQGVNTKISLSAVGGPTSIDILTETQTRSLVKNIDNGLWSGILNFEKPEVYQLIAKATDGAENKTERQLNTVIVLGNGKILNNNSPVTSGSVMLRYFDNQTQRFVVWDGKPYGQKNPQTITKNGEYGFIAPTGKYYLEVKSYRFKTLKSEIFTLTTNTPITPDLRLKKSFGLQIGSFFLALPDFSITRQNITINYPDIPNDVLPADNITGKEFPNVDLFQDSNKISTISLQGKPSVFTFLSTWSPYTSQQLNLMNGLAENTQINVFPVVSQETASSVSIFKKRGGYSLSILSDPDGLLVKPLNLSFFPTHVFVDRKGIIRAVKVGVLTADEIMENLIN